jgi:hypothetical protein
MTTCPIGPTCLGCAKCDPEYHAKRAAKRTLRSATDFTPPDIYKAGIERLQRAEAARTKTNYVPPATEMHLDANGIPDIYAAGLAAMKKESR